MTIRRSNLFFCLAYNLLMVYFDVAKKKNKFTVVAGNRKYIKTESEFSEFESRLKSLKNRFQLSAGLNFESLNTILSGTNNI